MMGLVEVAVWTLVEVTVLLPVAQLVTVCAERSSAVFFRDRFEISEEG